MYVLINKSHLLNYNFYLNDPAEVAKKLLGKILIRKYKNTILAGKIVETEAYYSKDDPASRAYKGLNKISELMFGEVGRLLVYTVHANLLMNIISHKSDEVGAVLIRALEPINGIREMKINRGTEDILQLCSGPGKLTKAFEIKKIHHGLDITRKNSEIVVIKNNNDKKFEIIKAFRIGVKKDLPRKLRFYVKGNKFVSRR